HLLSKEHTLRTPTDCPFVVVLGAQGWNITTIRSPTQPGWGHCPGRGWVLGGLGRTRYWVLESQTPDTGWVWFQPTGPTRPTSSHGNWFGCGWCLVVV